MVSGADNRSKDAKRLRLQRGPAPGPATRRPKPKEKPLTRAGTVSRPILRRQKNLAVAPTEQTRSSRNRKVKGSSEAEGVPQANGQESGEKGV